MTLKEMNDYLANGIAAGGITAAIALALTRNRKEKQFKPNDIESGNAIVVPIHKDKFLEGLLTPDQLAASRGATAAGAASEGSQLSEADILAKKKELMRHSRKIDFFGTKAEDAQDKTEKTEKTEPAEKTEQPKDGVEAAEDASKKDGGSSNGMPRDDQGRFISPTSPLAVKPAEKDASVFDRPLALVGGGAASLLIADMIVRAVNKKRAKRAEKNLNAEREKYVELLQNPSAKTAEMSKKALWNPGEILSGTFIIPAAVTALITNRIVENRKAQKKRDASRTDSFPVEPSVTYRVYDSANQTAKA